MKRNRLIVVTLPDGVEVWQVEKTERVSLTPIADRNRITKCTPNGRAYARLTKRNEKGLI